jgi:hypothetical protein
VSVSVNVSVRCLWSGILEFIQALKKIYGARALLKEAGDPAALIIPERSRVSGCLHHPEHPVFATIFKPLKHPLWLDIRLAKCAYTHTNTHILVRIYK